MEYHGVLYEPQCDPKAQLHCDPNAQAINKVPKNTGLKEYLGTCGAACSRIVPLRYVGAMSRELAERVQVAFDRCKAFPEVRKEGPYFLVKGDAYLALIELRNLAPEVVTALGGKNGSRT